jgi:hypothetical protein
MPIIKNPFRFDSSTSMELHNLLLNDNTNERDNILPFFRKHPLPLIIATVPLEQFGWISYEESILRKYRTDFVISDTCSMGITYSFIELELHNVRSFTKKRGDLSSAFAHAFTQILEWRYLVDNHRDDIFKCFGTSDSYKQYAAMRFVIVIGRRSDLDSEEIKKKYSALGASFKDTVVMTYDRLLQCCPYSEVLSKGKLPK